MTEESGTSRIPATAREVGLRGSRQQGWCSHDTSELVPGVVITPGMTVVDAGCGHGGYIEFCGQMGANITFIDLQEKHVRNLEEKLSGLENITSLGIVSDCSPIPLPDGYADLVICTEVLEHVPCPDAMMFELSRVAKDGAAFVLTVPDSRGENLIKSVAHPDYFKEPNHIRIFTLVEFEALVRSHGLEIEQHEYRGAFWALFFLFKWVTSEPGENLFEAVHPITELWTQTWDRVLDHPDGEKIVNALNQALPQSQVIVARKQPFVSLS